MILPMIQDEYAYLRAIIFASELGNEQKDLWYALLPSLEKSGTLAAVLTLVAEAPSALFELTDNLNKKAAAIASGDTTAFHTIVGQELEYIARF
jgi:hypothetical protein